MSTKEQLKSVWNQIIQYHLICLNTPGLNTALQYWVTTSTKRKQRRLLIIHMHTNKFYLINTLYLNKLQKPANRPLIIFTKRSGLQIRVRFTTLFTWHQLTTHSIKHHWPLVIMCTKQFTKKRSMITDSLLMRLNCTMLEKQLVIHFYRENTVKHTLLQLVSFCQ